MGIGEGEDSDEVDDEPGHGDDEEALGADARGVEKASEALGEDVHGDDGKEETVDEAGEDLEAVVPGIQTKLDGSDHEKKKELWENNDPIFIKLCFWLEPSPI